VKFIHPQDLKRSSLQNNFTLQGTAGILNLIDSKKFYCITEVRASGAWSCNYINSKGESFNRNGSGNLQYTVPWSAEAFNFTGILEVSGFFMEVG